MHKGKIAEWLLLLVMEPAQAASVVGDLLETSTSSSEIWFWGNVFQTWLLTLWDAGTSRPVFIVGLAVRATLVETGLVLFGSLGWVFVIAITGSAWAVVHAIFQSGHYTNGTLSFLAFHTASGGFQLWNYMVAPYCAARWIAKRSNGKEIVAVIAMAIVAPVIWGGLFLIVRMDFPHFLTQHTIASTSLWSWNGTGLFLGACLIGAALVRRRRLAVGAG